jgi:hypothetical protein
MIPITADNANDELFPTASAVLAEMDLSLSRSAVFLTVEGGTFEDDDSTDEEGEHLDDFSLLVSSFNQPRNDTVPPPYYPLRREELVDPEVLPPDRIILSSCSRHPLLLLASSSPPARIILSSCSHHPLLLLASSSPPDRIIFSCS